jgi:hypothetical protein
MVKVIDISGNSNTVNLSLLKWLKLKISGKTFLRYEKREGWKGKLPFYIVRCSRCKQLYMDYPHGHKNYFLCPNCSAKT